MMDNSLFLTCLSQLIQLGLADHRQSNLLALIANQLKSLFAADACYITLWDNTLEQVIPTTVTGELQKSYPQTLTIPGERTMTEAVLKAGHSLIAEDVHNTPYISPRIAAQFPAKSMLGLPMFADNEPLGAILIAHNKPYPFSEEEVEQGEYIASQVALILTKATMQETLQRQDDRFEILCEIHEKIHEPLTADGLFRLIANYIRRLTQADHGLVLLVNIESRRVEQVAGAELDPALLAEITFDQVENSLVGWAIRQLKPITSHIQYRRSPTLKKLPIIWPNNMLDHNAVIVPFKQSDTIIGVLCAINEPGQLPFLVDDQTTLGLLANQATIAIRQAEMNQAQETHLSQLQLILNSITDGIISLDKNCKIELVNATGAELLSLWAEATIGDLLPRLDSLSIETILAEAPTKTHKTILTKPEYPLDREFEVDLHRAANHGAVLVLREVTQERQLQSQLLQQDRLSAMGQLSASIAHDFNNILTVMIGFADLLHRRETKSIQDGRILAQIIEQGRRAALLVQRMLHFSQQSMPEREPLDIAMWLTEITDLLERLIPEDIKISLEISNEVLAAIVQADSIQLQQVITNLALNARDAMPEGGQLRFQLSPVVTPPHKTVLDTENETRQWLQLTIADTGHGITTEDMNHIFEPFFTTKEREQGTGLGLAQVYEIIAQHEGHVEVSSQVNKGTIFSIYLPTLPFTTPEATSNKSIIEIKGAGQLILLVEDNINVLHVTQLMLHELGYRVVVARNGQEAIGKYYEYREKIKLIITDATMPEMGGLTVAQVLHRANPTLKFIVVSGYPLNEAEAYLQRIGVVGVLQKPLSIEAIAKAVRQALA